MRAVLSLAFGFALKGRDARLRTALIALASGLAVALLLLAVSVPHALAAREARSNAWNPVTAGAPGDGALRFRTVSITVDRGSVAGSVASPIGARPPLPPGVTALPGNRAMLVSPALAAALAAPDGALLRARLPYRVAGEIGPSGLLGPTELRFFAIDSRFGTDAGNWTVGFGGPRAPEPLDPVLALLVVVGVAVLLLPVGVVVAIAGRYGAERRDRRLAALRLLGLGRSGVLGLTLLEAVLAALLGDAVGLAVFFSARQGLQALTVASLSVFPSDAVPPLPAAIAVLLLAPLLLGITALAGLRGVAVEPLGVARRARTGRRRLWWRLVPLVLSAPLLIVQAGRDGGAGRTAIVAAGVVLLLLGTLALLPWATEQVARGAHGRGSLSWQLAMRRAGFEGSTTARVVGAVTIALAGAIALQMLFVGLGSRYTSDTGVDAARTGTLLSATPTGQAAQQRLAQELQHALGPAAVLQTSGGTVGARENSPSVSIVVAECAALERIALLHGCRRGSVYRSGVTPPIAGHTVYIEGQTAWRAPAAVPEVPGGRDFFGGEVVDTLLLTPEALGSVQLPHATVVTLVPDRSPVLASVVSRAVALDPAMQLEQASTTQTAHRFDSVRRGLTIGLLLVMLLIGGVLLVSIGENLRERRRALAVLAAIGTPRAVMVRSILWEAALPVVVGTLLAVAAGATLGSVLLRVLQAPVTISSPSIGLAVVIALAVPLLVTALSLPAATRLMRPEGLRTE